MATSPSPSREKGKSAASPAAHVAKHMCVPTCTTTYHSVHRSCRQMHYEMELLKAYTHYLTYKTCATF
jgi:hypothetical protein